MGSCRNVILASVRSFSNSSSLRSQQLVKPPVQAFGLEGIYVNALYSASSKQKQLDTVEKELINLQKSLATSTVLRDFVLNPTIQRNVKVNVVKDICGKLSLSPSTSNFLTVLAENGRLRNLNSMINVFKKVMAAHRGDLPCEITTARPLDADLRKELETVLGSFTKKGENIILQTKVDPDIIGGMIVSIGDKYVDLSTASKIKKYSDILKSTV